MLRSRLRTRPAASFTAEVDESDWHYGRAGRNGIGPATYFGFAPRRSRAAAMLVELNSLEKAITLARSQRDAAQ